ncbi:MAG: CapA family protein, partial [Desulfobacteraceae bacterium]|nr:CapA family protein [Desulfobacteraceae bacterium]
MAMTPDFNWTNGTWDCRRNLDRIRLCIAGDWAPIRNFAPIMAQNPAAVYGDLFDSLNKADLKIFNLEAPLAHTCDTMVKSGAAFRADPCHIQALDILSVDAVTLANNHIWDCGLPGFHQTLETLTEKGIRWTGAGRNLAVAAAPLILEKNTLKIGIINFSEGEDLTCATSRSPGVMGWDPDLMEAQVKALRSAVDLVLVIAHCGIEYMPFPPLYVTGVFQRLAEAGADLVVGHHPHVPQGLQIHKGTPLFYSLGNFVFFQPTDLLFRKLGFVLFVELDSQGIAALEMAPYQIHDQGLGLLTGPPKTDFFTAFRQISDPLQTPRGQEEIWHALLHYYGTHMMEPELAGILDKLKTDPPKGAAMFRNRLTTPQHCALLTDTMTRIMAGRLDDAAPWALDIVHEWMTRKIPGQP